MPRLLLFLILLISAPLPGQTHYYVDQSTGSDQNDGLTPQTAWATIQKAGNSATPNSIVQIKEGTYHENIQISVSGTSGNPITFTNFQDDLVVVDGTGTNGTSLMRITDESWLNFENMEFKNLVRNNARGIMVETSVNGYARNLTFKNIKIHNIRWTSVDDVIPATGHNARGFAAVGRGGGIEYLSIIDCTIHDNVTGKSEALTLNGNIEDFLIEGCTVYDNTNIGISLAGNYGVCNDPTVDRARNGVVRNNTCHNNVSLLASSAGIYVDGGENIVIERNSCFQNGTGISVGCEQNGVTQFITVKNNLIYDNDGRGLAVGGYTLLTTGEVIYSTFRNNTIYQNNNDFGFSSEVHISKASNCVFEDNIIYANDQNIVLAVEAKLPQENNLFNYNCYYTASGDPDDINVYWHALSFDSLGELQQGLGQEQNSIFANPLWTASAPQVISGASLCVDAGNPNLTIEPGELDFAGQPRITGQGVDIGALEINTTLGVPDFMDMAKVFPNPLSGNTLYTSLELQDAVFSLYDLGGRCIIKISNVNGNRIHLPEVVSGLYIYNFSQGGKKAGTGKLVVN